jgi:hypothetical protein
MHRAMRWLEQWIAMMNGFTWAPPHALQSVLFCCPPRTRAEDKSNQKWTHLVAPQGGHPSIAAQHRAAAIHPHGGVLRDVNADVRQSV